MVFEVGDCSFRKLISLCCSVQSMFAEGSSLRWIGASCVDFAASCGVSFGVASTNYGVLINLFVVCCVGRRPRLWSSAKGVGEESRFRSLGFFYNNVEHGVPSSGIVHIDWASHCILVHIQPRHRHLVMEGLLCEAMWLGCARGGEFAIQIT